MCLLMRRLIDHMHKKTVLVTGSTSGIGLEYDAARNAFSLSHLS